jgi:hypothetical protein
MNTGSMLKIDSSNFLSGDVFKYVTTCALSIRRLSLTTRARRRDRLHALHTGLLADSRRGPSHLVFPKQAVTRRNMTTTGWNTIMTGEHFQDFEGDPGHSLSHTAAAAWPVSTSPLRYSSITSGGNTVSQIRSTCLKLNTLAQSQHALWLITSISKFKFLESQHSYRRRKPYCKVPWRPSYAKWRSRDNVPL